MFSVSLIRGENAYRGYLGREDLLPSSRGTAWRKLSEVEVKERGEKKGLKKGARGKTRRNAFLTRGLTENNRLPLAVRCTPPEDQTDPPSVNGALMHTFHCAACTSGSWPIRSRFTRSSPPRMEMFLRELRTFEKPIQERGVIKGPCCLSNYLDTLLLLYVVLTPITLTRSEGPHQRLAAPKTDPTSRATKDSGVSYAVDMERNSKVAATLWEVLTYPSRKLADLLAMPVCMRPRDRGAKLHSWSSFRVACVLTFRAPSRQIRCWNAGPLVGATQCPRSPFPLLAACIGKRYSLYTPCLDHVALEPLESSGESLIRGEVISCLCGQEVISSNGRLRPIYEQWNIGDAMGIGRGRWLSEYDK
ncbi:hypothetical protein ALC57_09765 [Trachymyrmex cornetzi]|uniref:Uncharacterized protein n=1 Tax=Trachymyrmex cornetzi TaxID=471704 RepID=A0A195DYC5_9HYME|nr:hypothetical protein ALC57_09765 [Trachymyrmex cornetzi]